MERSTECTTLTLSKDVGFTKNSFLFFTEKPLKPFQNAISVSIRMAIRNAISDAISPLNAQKLRVGKSIYDREESELESQQIDVLRNRNPIITFLKADEDPFVFNRPTDCALAIREICWE